MVLRSHLFAKAAEGAGGGVFPEARGGPGAGASEAICVHFFLKMKMKEKD